jgi:hypothetical protein
MSWKDRRLRGGEAYGMFIFVISQSPTHLSLPQVLGHGD